MQNDLAKQLLDSDGKLKRFDSWINDIRSISDHYVRNWLQTEYSTAIIRARQAADWQHFEQEADVLPNLRWMPTTSPNPESEHRQYWERKLTLPVGDPFWDKHRPGDRWNCKCSLMATDEPATPGGSSGLRNTPGQPGLDSNPGKDGQIFSRTHPYYTQAYPGAEKAVRKVVESENTVRRRRRTPEEADDIRSRWNERREIWKKAGEWANDVPDGVVRSDAEKAARSILTAFGKDYGLPHINISNLGGKSRRGVVIANYSKTSDVLTINSNKAAQREYAELNRKSAEWGWNSQKNPVLHELSHQVHAKFDKDFDNRHLQIVGLDRKYVKQNLSEYALTNRAEYEAELISGILSGKKYPDRVMARSVFSHDRGHFGRILVKKGRDMSPEAVSSRRLENRRLAGSLEDWYKEKMPETIVGNSSARRFTVQRVDGDTVIVNKTFYNKMISSYSNDLFYADKLDKARIAHNLIKDARYVRTEDGRHDRHAGETFRVYERTYDDTVYELKVRCTENGNYLYYMRNL